MSKQRKHSTDLIDYFCRLYLIRYRLIITDETMDRIAREFKQLTVTPQNPKNKTKLKKTQKRIDEIRRENEVLFHVLIVNLFSLNEVIGSLKKLNDPQIKKIHKSLKEILNAFKEKRKIICDWRSNITAHGDLYGRRIRGPSDITKPKKFQNTIYLLTKFGCMYCSAILLNFPAERGKALKRLQPKWRTNEDFFVSDYFNQLKRAKKLQLIVNSRLKKNNYRFGAIFVGGHNQDILIP